MTDPSEFWMENTSSPGHQVVAELLGDRLRGNQSGEYSGHPVWYLGYDPEYELATAEPALRDRLDAIGWQVVRTEGYTIDGFPAFGIAPLLGVEAEIVYHVTPVDAVGATLRDGLLSGHPLRTHTGFPDTIGKIFGCLKLTHQDDQNDSARWWCTHFAGRYGRAYAVLQMDVRDLAGGRTTRDTHSRSGVVIDRVDRIDRVRILRVE
jgi:hypothetical protein